MHVIGTSAAAIIVIYFGWDLGAKAPGGTDVLVMDEPGGDVRAAYTARTSVPYERVKMDLKRMHAFAERPVAARGPRVVGAAGRPGDGAQAQTTQTLPDGFDGGAMHHLPVLDQRMCGSCWAIACSTALKANLRLHTVAALASDELPNLAFMLSCSRVMHQTVNPGGGEPHARISFEPARLYEGGCSGGLVGMALAMLQARRELRAEPVESYLAGGDVEESRGAARYHNRFMNPVHSCELSKTLGRPVGASMDLHGLDTLHLAREKTVAGVRLPTTRSVREFILRHGAAVAYVDVDSGMKHNSLLKARGVVRLPACRWSRDHFHQSGAENGYASSDYDEADHAVVLTGWDCEKQHWIIQNSWGNNWARGGVLWAFDSNVCADDEVSAHSHGVGPACIFGSTISAFTLR